MSHYNWIRLVRQALAIDTFQTADAKAYATQLMMRDLEKTCPEAWRAVVRSSKEA